MSAGVRTLYVLSAISEGMWRWCLMFSDFNGSNRVGASPHLRTEANPVSETLCSVENWTMDTVKKPEIPRFTSSSSSFSSPSSSGFPSKLIWSCGSYRQLVGFFGRGISLVARPLPTQGNRNTAQTRTDTHASSGIRTHDPSVWAGKYTSRVRPRCHCDTQYETTISLSVRLAQKIMPYLHVAICHRWAQSNPHTIDVITSWTAVLSWTHNSHKRNATGSSSVAGKPFYTLKLLTKWK
jgi:hypothetical protein